MSALIINEHPLMVLPALATKIGLNEAIFLQQLHYWAVRSDFQKDGRSWVYNTVEQWREQFPFWSVRTINRIVDNLKTEGYLAVEQYGSAFDRTNYYAINYDKIEVLDDANLAQSDDANLAQSDDANLAQSDDANLAQSSSREYTENTTDINIQSKKQKIVIDYQAIADAYNEILPERPKVLILTKKRISALDKACRIKSSWNNPEFWKCIFREVRQDSAMMNGTATWGGADFDFIIREPNLIKLFEKAYQRG